MTERGKNIDRSIKDVHQRFTAAVTGRLPAMTADQKQRYFALLSKVVGKLEQKDKSLKQALQEVVPEVLPLILQELSGR